jgi:hypothetical protein
MRGKKAKVLRKEARKEVEMRKEQKLADINLAGCPSCEGYQWYVELDRPAPHHTWINFLICANPLCNCRLPIRFNIDDAPTMEEMEAVLTPIEDEAVVLDVEEQEQVTPQSMPEI